MVGSKRHASIAVRLYLSHALRYTRSVRVNKNWRVIGRGSYRSALLHVPTNIVYKVPHDAWGEESVEAFVSANLAGTHRLHNSNVDMIIPVVTAYKIGNRAVVAMEHFDPPSYDNYFPDDLDNACMRRGWYDLHTMNVVKVDTGWIVIDLDNFDWDARPLDTFIPV